MSDVGFAGRLLVKADTVEMVDASPACTAVPRDQLLEPLTFRCRQYTITAERGEGRWRIEYRTVRIEQTETSECAERQSNPNYRVPCTRYIKEVHEREVPASGTLRLKAIGPPST